MQIGKGEAPGKVILFGEHAVVYGRPALATPVTQVTAVATVETGADGGVVIVAPDVGETIALRTAPRDHPLAEVVRLTLAHFDFQHEPDWHIVVRSTIPIAGGLGSGAAVSTALIRALAAAAQQTMDAAAVSELVYKIERLHHGAPSGVDNTVIAFGQPAYFMRGRAPTPFTIAKPFWLAIGDSGIVSPTRVTVADVRRRWESDRVGCEALFDRIGALVEQARAALACGQTDALGPLMNENHALLSELEVSCAALDRLVAAACAAGAHGAKLSGGGRGGNMIALVTHETAPRIVAALRDAGAVQVIVTEVK